MAAATAYRVSKRRLIETTEIHQSGEVIVHARERNCVVPFSSDFIFPCDSARMWWNSDKFFQRVVRDTRHSFVRRRRCWADSNCKHFFSEPRAHRNSGGPNQYQRSSFLCPRADRSRDRCAGSELYRERKVQSPFRRFGQWAAELGHQSGWQSEYLDRSQRQRNTGH